VIRVIAMEDHPLIREGIAALIGTQTVHEQLRAGDVAAVARHEKHTAFAISGRVDGASPRESLPAAY